VFTDVNADLKPALSFSLSNHLPGADYLTVEICAIAGFFLYKIE